LTVELIFILLLFIDMKPIEKFNELSHHATSNIEYESRQETRGDPMQIQLQVDDSEVKRRELASRQAL
jgi:hypothetical protein